MAIIPVAVPGVKLNYKTLAVNSLYV